MDGPDLSAELAQSPTSPRGKAKRGESRAAEPASLRLNDRAAVIADGMAADAVALRITVSELATGSRVIDCGIAVPGGLETGRLLAETDRKSVV